MEGVPQLAKEIFSALRACGCEFRRDGTALVVEHADPAMQPILNMGNMTELLRVCKNELLQRVDSIESLLIRARDCESAGHLATARAVHQMITDLDPTNIAASTFLIAINSK